MSRLLTNQEIFELTLHEDWARIIEVLKTGQWDPNCLIHEPPQNAFPLLPDPDSQRKFPLLLCAVAKAQTRAVQTLIQLGADVNWRDRRTGETALWHAVMSGKEEILDLLLATGAKPNVKAWSKTPLMEAAQMRNKGFVQKLLNAGARPADKAMKGKSALSFVFESGVEADPELVSMLLDAGCPVDPRDLHAPIGRRELATVKLLLSKNPDVNTRFDWSTSGNDVIKGDTPLLVATTDTVAEALAKSNPSLGASKPVERLAILDLLLAAGADVNARRLKNGYTPLLLAALFDEAEIAQRLIHAGADPAQEFECVTQGIRSLWDPQARKKQQLSAIKLAQKHPRNKKIRKLLLGTE